MSIVRTGLFLLLIAGFAQGAIYKPTPRKATATRNVASGKVKILPATSLPAGAIVPGSRPAATQQSGTNAPAGTPHAQPAPAIAPTHQIQVAINPDRWQFYSYP